MFWFRGDYFAATEAAPTAKCDTGLWRIDDVGRANDRRRASGGADTLGSRRGNDRLCSEIV